MAGSMDIVIIMARLSKPPERVKSPINGVGSYVRFQVASNYSRKDDFGDWIPVSEFYWVHCYDRLAEIAESFLYTGCVVGIIGGFRRKRSGNDGDVIINARDIQLIGDCLNCKPKRQEKEAERASSF